MSRGQADAKCLSAARTAAIALLALCLVPLLHPAGADAAVERHLFDAEISLRGGCETDASDPVPDPWCPGPPGPSKPFENPNIAIDSYGDMYVSSHPDTGTTGQINVFSPAGEFITEIQLAGAASLAVDPKGNLYVNQAPTAGPGRVILYRPSSYDPGAEEIAYEDPGEVIIENEVLQPPCSAKRAIDIVSLAVDPTSEKLYVSPGESCVGEWSSASSPGGPELLNSEIGAGVLDVSAFAAIDAAHERLYVSEENRSAGKELIQVFELSAPHAHLGTLDGHVAPAGAFLGNFGREPIAVDETTGNLIVSELVATPRVLELGPGLGASEELLETYEYSGFKSGGPYEVAVDNAPASPNFRSFFVPSSSGSTSHTFAFRFSVEEEPEVESVAVEGISETEAVLRGTVNPGGGETSYRVEYTSGESFEGATLAAEGTLPAGIGGVPVSAPAAGLSPGTLYRFRVSAENDVGDDEMQGSFRTYTAPAAFAPCPNDALRSGFSANLPDCRAYELVTPPATNGHNPMGAADTGPYFPTLQASPEGDRASFRIEGGAIGGFEASGSANGDNYRARRGADGWSTEYAGASGTQAIAPLPGGFSPDQEFAFWNGGSVSSGEALKPYIRYPDGHSEPVGRGSFGTDPGVEAKLIAKDASHTIFRTVEGKAIRLEPDAPPAGTAAIYDRTADEVTHVISLLPGNVTPGAGKHASYIGASLDGEGVAFLLEGSSTLYLRRAGVSYEVGSGLTFAGLSEGGDRLFYLQGGNLFAFDAASESAIQFSEGGETTPVNVSADGSTAYFISPDVLTGAEQNPSGDVAQPGGENLYASREGTLSFLATVDPLDAKEAFGGSGGQFLGLGQWVSSLKSTPAIETSRSTPDGNVLLFESRAQLGDYDPDEHTQIYRYDLEGPSLSCLSCNPTGVAPTGNATLQTLPLDPGVKGVLGLADRMLNTSPDGDRIFFQSYEPLVLTDTDARQDVYEWEAQGVGSCTESGGCTYLISSGQSERDEHLFAVSQDGADVFFLSGDRLLGADLNTTPSIYDARVEGGFPEAPDPAPCQGEACRAPLAPAPALPAPATPLLGAAAETRSCPQGPRRRAKRLAKRAKRMRRAARRGDDARRKQRLRRGAARSARQAKRLSRAARRCRRAGRRPR